ncbi:hypothetical protein DAPPUDRAFT_236228 [Daphnia pulex]|uniref:Tyrosine-protein phosphatase domain-containing protein n=1 Tax=Daphnia pulex TaxID=6669 RepID=E9G1J5_DAPPU|nr:hypothetical protein DAPPUDRAFT_236228 [Daphnia pulex]|eukprot:EFX86506.1 hypothetical protein DAPPUDRAFT_236228 [Daphnia pulex]
MSITTATLQLYPWKVPEFILNQHRELKGATSMRRGYKHPLEATVSDFGEMVWDHNSQTVVVLSYTADEDYQVRMWNLKTFASGLYDHKIQLPAVGNHPAHPDEYVTQMEVAAPVIQDDYELWVFYCPSWPYRGAANPDLAALFRLPKFYKTNFGAQSLETMLSTTTSSTPSNILHMNLDASRFGNHAVQHIQIPEAE